MSDLIFDGLNLEQKRAVETLEGPVLILAGAGSGKTRALTHRIAHLIAQGVQPWQILAVTFTNKAANEMKTRITNLLHLTGASPLDSSAPSGRPAQGDRQSRLPVMGTFHSVCVRILRRDIERIGRNRNFVIYDSDDQEKLMKEVLREMQIDPKELKPKTALGHMSRFKSEAFTPKEVAQQATTEWMARVVNIYGRYQTTLRQHNAMDFDDLILEVIRLFREAPDVLDRYQETWRYLNVDEYQDTNHAQYLLISLLAEKYRNLCVIGDPDQSIYAFRGADIRNILQFQHEYKNAATIKLERNYRSTQQILDAADAVIAVNPGRPEKKMWTERIDGEKIVLHEMRDEKEEAREAVQSAMNAMAQGTPLNEQVILYRTNAQSRLFEEACMKTGVPYRIVGGVKFYARREVKDVLAYLHTIHNPADALSLLRIINVPSRKIGTTTIERIQKYCNERQCSLWEALKSISVGHASSSERLCHAERSKPAGGGTSGDEAYRRSSAQHDTPELPDPVKNRIAEFVVLIEKYRERRLHMNVFNLSRELLAETKMETWVKDASTPLSTSSSEGESRWENVGELLSVMQKYDKLEPEQSFVNFLEEVALVSEVDKLEETQSDALTLMTLHLCKGLEFRHVIIAGCEEGIFPHSNALFNKEQLEEERRLMYVGMTRAKDLLRIFAARSRMQFGNTQANPMSRFLDDIPQQLTERKSDDLMSGVLWRFSSPARRSLSEGGSEAPFGFSQDRLRAESRSHQGALRSDFSTRPGSGRGSLPTPPSPPAGRAGLRGAGEENKTKLQPFRQHQNLTVEFNQDVFARDDVNQDGGEEMIEGSRIRHPVFGEGTVTGRRGDVVDVTFDSGEKKRFALSIAPLEVV